MIGYVGGIIVIKWGLGVTKKLYYEIKLNVSTIIIKHNRKTNSPH
jgi:hypothetical protein